MSFPSATGAPTLIEVWAPHCSNCRAIEGDLLAAANAQPTVELVRIDATKEQDLVRAYGVKGTPTIIGVRDGTEVFRRVGRPSRSELDDLFEALARGAAPVGIPQDVWLRGGSAALLIGAGLALGPAWPLIALGAVIGIWAAVPLLQRSL